MRNQQTGKFEVRRFLKATNTEIVGSGDTQAEARQNFELKLEQHRTTPLQPSGVTVRSPGFQMFHGENGRVVYRHNPDRRAQVLAARPELAEVIRENASLKKARA